MDELSCALAPTTESLWSLAMKIQSILNLLTIAIACLGSYIFAFAQFNSHSLASKAFMLKSAGKIGDKTKIEERLQSLGGKKSYVDFRVEQLVHTSTTFLITFSLIYLFFGSFFKGLSLACIASALIFFAIDKSLTHEIDKTRRQLEAEFPAIIEMMSLSLSAGETPAQALFRISGRAHGLLARHFETTVEDIRRGVPFHEALDAMGRRIDSLVIRRFVDALVTAVVRGAPLVEVLQRHAMESRQAHKNAVLNKAGKAEISMMIPIVFLILPISILFALWPSLSTLNLFSS